MSKTTEGNKTQTKHKLGIIFLIIILVVITAYGLYKIYNNRYSYSATESFASGTSIINGNLIKYSITPNELKRPLSDAETRNIIRLQNQIKLTGFKFVSKSPGDNTKYRLFIAESMQLLLNPRTRIEVLIPGVSLELNSMYSDTNFFETENGTPRYTGSCLAINTVAGAESWLDIGEYQIYGLALNSPTQSDYDGYTSFDLSTNNGKEILGNKLIVKLENDADKMVGKLIVSNFTSSTNYSPQCQIKYRNSLTNTTSLFGINGPIRDRFINPAVGTTSTSWTIYLEKPVLANYLELTFFGGAPDNTPLNIGINADISVFGFTPSNRDLDNYKLQAGQSDSNARLNLGGTSCPATSEMLNKQVQAQLICEALEYKDKEKNKRLAYERDKLYLQKLKAQDEEIKELETHINGLISRKNELASKSQGANIESLEKELKAASIARQQAEDYLKAKDAARDTLRLKFKMDPQFQELLGNSNESSAQPN